jgi:hypothetical protein
VKHGGIIMVCNLGGEIMIEVFNDYIFKPIGNAFYWIFAVTLFIGFWAFIISIFGWWSILVFLIMCAID